MKTIAIVAGKPSIVDETLPIIMPDHADHRILIVPYWLWGVFRRFSMPRGLGMADVPYVGTPHWRPWERQTLSSAFQWTAGRRVSLDVTPFEALARADETICIVDPCPVEAHSAAMLIAHAYGRSMLGDEYAAFESIDSATRPEDLPFPDLRYVPTDSLDADRILHNWNLGLTTHSPEFIDLVRHQCCVRFFNAAFHINSMLVLDPVLRGINPLYEGGLIGKSPLQILHLIAEKDGLSMSSLIRRMEDWKGTGSHPDVPVGNAATRHQIVENLVNAGLVQVSNTLYRASPAGRMFLASLHKDCRDFDVFARLETWSRQWPASRPAVERYLRTFFGKQKRLNSRSRG